MSATACAFASVSSNCGLTPFARATNSITASDPRQLIGGFAAGPPGSASGVTSISCSPYRPRGPRLVTRSLRRGAASMSSLSEARMRREDARGCRAPGGSRGARGSSPSCSTIGRVACSVRPEACARSWVRRASGSRSGARFTKKVPSANASAQLPGNPRRQARLARSAGSREGHQPPFAEEGQSTSAASRRARRGWSAAAGRFVGASSVRSGGNSSASPSIDELVTAAPARRNP